jgi:hypothetical protein
MFNKKDHAAPAARTFKSMATPNLIVNLPGPDRSKWFAPTTLLLFYLRAERVRRPEQGGWLGLIGFPKVLPLSLFLTLLADPLDHQ